jgi:nitrate reductase NapE component
MRFAPGRGDYYDYLADMIEGLQGRKTLRDLFEDDAHRYGLSTVRGRLAQRWSRALEADGGDIATAWLGTLPVEELALLRVAQAAGAGAFTATLRDLARVVQVVEQASRMFLASIAAGVIACCVALALIYAVPFLSAPRLQAVFHAVPPTYYGVLTRGLFGFAQVLLQLLPVLTVGTVGGIWLILWSLPNLSGPLRTHLDRWAIWRFYRDINGVRFLAMLAVLVRQRGNVDMRLRQALAMQAAHARPWLGWHIENMVARIDAGMVGADTFDTGLIDVETWWYLSDMIAAHGMASGMRRACARVEAHVLPRVRRNAQRWRWALLLSAVTAVIGLTFWHYAVIDELRRAMINVSAAF